MDHSPDVCKADRDHDCSCEKSPKDCRSNYHDCLCDDEKRKAVCRFYHDRRGSKSTDVPDEPCAAETPTAKPAAEAPPVPCCPHGFAK